MNTTTQTTLVAFFAALALVATRTFNDKLNAATDRVKATGTCCALATRRFCVCRVSVTCPDHGTICVGNHD